MVDVDGGFGGGDGEVRVDEAVEELGDGEEGLGGEVGVGGDEDERECCDWGVGGGGCG